MIIISPQILKYGVKLRFRNLIILILRQMPTVELDENLEPIESGTLAQGGVG